MMSSDPRALTMVIRMVFVWLAATLPACVTIQVGDQPEAAGQDVQATAPASAASPAASEAFQVWDMHASGLEPSRSVKIIDPDLAARGYWLSSAFLGMPKSSEEARIGAGGLIDQADLGKRELALQQRISASGIAGTPEMVMLDAEAFKPYDGPAELEWYNRTARVASGRFARWFWYFQPGRFENAPSGRFKDEDAFFDWYAQQEFMQRASAISVTLYHGRDRDASSPASASSRTRNDMHLKRAIEFAGRMNKPLIVLVRADMAGKPREQIMTTEALEASWRELFLRQGIDGIAIWNDQPEDQIEFDRRWSASRIEPTLRKLREERARWLEGRRGRVNP